MEIKPKNNLFILLNQLYNLGGEELDEDERMNLTQNFLKEHPVNVKELNSNEMALERISTLVSLMKQDSLLEIISKLFRIEFTLECLHSHFLSTVANSTIRTAERILKCLCYEKVDYVLSTGFLVSWNDPDCFYQFLTDFQGKDVDPYLGNDMIESSIFRTLICPDTDSLYYTVDSWAGKKRLAFEETTKRHINTENIMDLITFFNQIDQLDNKKFSFIYSVRTTYRSIRRDLSRVMKNRLEEYQGKARTKKPDYDYVGKLF